MQVEHDQFTMSISFAAEAFIGGAPRPYGVEIREMQTKPNGFSTTKSTYELLEWALYV